MLFTGMIPICDCLLILTEGKRDCQSRRRATLSASTSRSPIGQLALNQSNAAVPVAALNEEAATPTRAVPDAVDEP